MFYKPLPQPGTSVFSFSPASSYCLLFAFSGLRYAKIPADKKKSICQRHCRVSYNMCAMPNFRVDLQKWRGQLDFGAVKAQKVLRDLTFFEYWRETFKNTSVPGTGSPMRKDRKNGFLKVTPLTVFQGPWLVGRHFRRFSASSMTSIKKLAMSPSSVQGGQYDTTYE